MPLTGSLGVASARASRFPDVPLLVQSGLILNLDATTRSSYLGSGTTWFDLSNNTFNSTLASGQAFSTDGGGSVVFTGNPQFVTGSNNATLNTTGDMTVSVWFKVTSNAADWVRVFGKGDAAANRRTYGLWYNTGAQNFLYQRYGAINIDAITTTPVNLNVWYNMVGVSSGTNHTLYLNNTSVGTASTGSTFVSSLADPYTVGYDGNLHTYHNGLVSQICVYNRALSPSELNTNFNNLRTRYGV